MNSNHTAKLRQKTLSENRTTAVNYIPNDWYFSNRMSCPLRCCRIIFCDKDVCKANVEQKFLNMRILSGYFQIYMNSW